MFFYERIFFAQILMKRCSCFFTNFHIHVFVKILNWEEDADTPAGVDCVFETFSKIGNDASNTVVHCLNGTRKSGINAGRPRLVMHLATFLSLYLYLLPCPLSFPALFLFCLNLLSNACIHGVIHMALNTFSHLLPIFCLYFYLLLSFALSPFLSQVSSSPV